MNSECCDANPYNDMWHEIDGATHGICEACGEHAVFYDEEEWRENTLEKDKEQHGELWETMR